MKKWSPQIVSCDIVTTMIYWSTYSLNIYIFPRPRTGAVFPSNPKRCQTQTAVPITIYNSLLRSLGNVPEQGFRQDFTDNKLHTSTGSPSPSNPRTLHSLQYPESFLHVNISPFIFPISPSLRVHLSYPQSNSCERFCDLSYLQTFDSIPVQYFPSRRLRERYHLVYCCFIRTSDIALSDILR